MMRSLGYRSDLGILAFRALIEPKARYTVVRTPGWASSAWKARPARPGGRSSARSPGRTTGGTG
jgi:hypothetical protein